MTSSYFNLHSTALAIVSVINFHSFFDVLCQTVYTALLSRTVYRLAQESQFFLTQSRLSATFSVVLVTLKSNILLLLVTLSNK
jgi:hypothetical protein